MSLLPVKIVSVNISKQKGTKKVPVEFIELNQQGIAGDAHAGHWHRQVSLLADESIQRASTLGGMQLEYGDFAENITTHGIELTKTTILDRFVSNEVVLEVTQIGKKCHSQCQIGQRLGECIMPLEGIFCKVIKGGKLMPGDVLHYQPYILKVAVITLSDRASEGIYTDKSGPEVTRLLTESFKTNNRHYQIENILIPDNKWELEKSIKSCLQSPADIIITTGSTGLGPRDIAPDVVRPMLDREVPGIMEFIRQKYGAKNPNALISRAIAGAKDRTLFYCIPGSTKAVQEYMEEIIPTLEHSLRMLHGVDYH